MQPLAGGDSRGILLSSRNGNRSLEPLNTEKFWHKNAEDVAVDEVFFHKYFSHIGKSKQVSVKKGLTSRATEDSDKEDDENEDEIWQALVDSRPEVEGPSDEDTDMEMLDLDDSDLSVDDLEDESEEDASVSQEARDEESESDEIDEDLISGSDVEADVDDLFERELRPRTEKPGNADIQSSKEKRRKLKSLPTFASAEDYAEMLDNDEDEDFGGGPG